MLVFLDTFVLCVWVLCLPACVHQACTWFPQKSEGGTGSLELELQTVISHRVGAENQTQILVQAQQSTFNHGVIFPAPSLFLSKSLIFMKNTENSFLAFASFLCLNKRIPDTHSSETCT